MSGVAYKEIIMRTYIVKWDFNKFQPNWSGDLPKLFGKYNEGVKQEASSEQEAKTLFAKKYNLNPFYLCAKLA